MQKSFRSKLILFFNASLCMTLLYFPILVLMVYSFNASRGTLVWEGFTLSWFVSVFNNPSIVAAMLRSIEVATLSASLATVIGLMVCLGLRSLGSNIARRYELFFLLPILVPEIVAAVGLLMTFAKIYKPGLEFIGLSQSSLVSITAGHLTFALAYVIVIIKARIAHLDPALDDAARNLGASKWQVFWWITLPDLMPALICAFLLVFTLSLDDFYLSHFLSYGGTGYTTLPVYLFGLQARSALTPEMNAVACLMILVSLSLLALAMRTYWTLVNQKNVRLKHEF